MLGARNLADMKCLSEYGATVARSKIKAMTIYCLVLEPLRQRQDLGETEWLRQPERKEGSLCQPHLSESRKGTPYCCEGTLGDSPGTLGPPNHRYWTNNSLPTVKRLSNCLPSWDTLTFLYRKMKTHVGKSLHVACYYFSFGIRFSEKNIFVEFYYGREIIIKFYSIPVSCL